MAQVLKTVNLGFTILEFHKDFVVSTVKEDSQLDKSHIDELRRICYEYFKYQNFAYIANRKVNYNVNPLIYINLLQRNTLKGIGVISDNISRLKTANFEKQFSPVPFELFNNLQEAEVWAQGIVTEQ